MSHRVDVLIRIQGDLLELGDVVIPEDADPSSVTVAAALETVAERIRTWGAFRAIVGPLGDVA